MYRSKQNAFIHDWSLSYFSPFQSGKWYMFKTWNETTKVYWFICTLKWDNFLQDANKAQNYCRARPTKENKSHFLCFNWIHFSPLTLLFSMAYFTRRVFTTRFLMWADATRAYLLIGHLMEGGFVLFFTVFSCPMVAALPTTSQILFSWALKRSRKKIVENLRGLLMCKLGQRWKTEKKVENKVIRNLVCHGLCQSTSSWWMRQTRVCQEKSLFLRKKAEA